MEPQNKSAASPVRKKRLHKAWWLGGGLLLALAVGWQARYLLGVPYFNDVPSATYEALQEADIYEVVSLAPGVRPRLEGAGEEPAGRTFHGYLELGRVAITDAGVRDRLNKALREGARANAGTVAMCFNPRHGIHAVHGGKETDLVICFECLRVHVHGAGKNFLTEHSPQPVFDEVLTQAGIPLAGKPK